MLTLRAGRQPQRRAATSGRTTRRASENATKVPVSKKCKLDIKRKHLRAAIPGCLMVNSYAVNLQLQIDNEKLPDLYKCTIKKHVNNKTSCVSYRLQGTGIYNHLRGLYMRGFSCGEEPGIVVLVASREAAPDLSYSGQSEGEDAGGAAEACVVAKDDTDTEANGRQQRQRRQQRPQRQRKRRRDDSDADYEGDDGTAGMVGKVQCAQLALAGPSGRHPGLYPELQQGATTVFQQFQHPHQHHQQHLQSHQDLYHEHRHERLCSHPLQPFDPSPIADNVGLHAHALSISGGGGSTYIVQEQQRVHVETTLDVPGVDDFAAVMARAEQRTAQAGPGPGQGSNLDPFEQLTLGVGMGFSDGSSSLLSNAAQEHTSCLLGPGLLGPDAGVCTAAAGTAQMHTGAVIVASGEADGGVLHSAAPALPAVLLAQRDPLLDLPLSMSPFSPRLLQELTGRPHLPRVGAHHAPSQMGNGWGALPLDFDNTWPRQHLTWPESLSLGL